MGDILIDDDVRALLRERVRTFEALELLKLLRAEPDECWSPDAAGARLKLAPADAEEALVLLAGQGLLESKVEAGLTRFCWAPAPELEEAAARLLAQYDTDRIAVMKAMSAAAVERVRGGVLRTFADAFLWRKKDG